jgi:hypothetical protein
VTQVNGGAIIGAMWSEATTYESMVVIIGTMWVKIAI